jgi:hypothetical protein
VALERLARARSDTLVRIALSDRAVPIRRKISATTLLMRRDDAGRAAVFLELVKGQGEGRMMADRQRALAGRGILFARKPDGELPPQAVQDWT